MGKRVLVTGAAGFIGSHLANYLSHRGYRVRALDLPAADVSVLSKGIDFIPDNLCEPKNLSKALQGVDLVIHTAAIFDFSAPEKLLQRVNVGGTENLCRAALKSRVKRLINFSSFGVYGDFGFTTPSFITEETPKKPANPYGRSKYEQDRIIYKYGKKGLSWTIVRPSVPYGPRNRYGAFQIFKTISLLPVVPLPANLKFRSGYIHVDDVVRAVMHLACRSDTMGEEYNLTDSSHYTIPQLMKLLADIFHKPTVPAWLPLSLAPLLIRGAEALDALFIRVLKKRPFISRDALAYTFMDLPFSNQKLLGTGYKFKYPYPDQGMKETVEWYRSQKIL